MQPTVPSSSVFELSSEFASSREDFFFTLLLFSLYPLRSHFLPKKYNSLAKDIFHETVKLALIKDGWTITSDPLTIRSDRIKLEVDLGAEKVFAAEKDGKKIAVEVKSFVNSSNISTIVGRGLAFAPQFLTHHHNIDPQMLNLLRFHR